MDTSSADINPQTQYVNCDRIRQIFAEGDYSNRFRRGEFAFEVIELGPPLVRPGESMPSDAREQIVYYLAEDGTRIARIHQRAGFENGLPVAWAWDDPKYLFHEGVRYEFKTWPCEKEPCECRRGEPSRRRTRG